jgi:hypothetical protein
MTTGLSVAAIANANRMMERTKLKDPSHDITIAMPCPNCADITRKHFAWFKRHTFYGCEKCRAVIEIDPSYHELPRGYEALVKALNAAFGEFFDD